MKNKSLGLIGHGHLGKALANQIQAKTNHKLNVSAARGQNLEIVDQSDLILLCVRPNQVTAAIEEIRNALDHNKVLISFAAAFPHEKLDRLSPETVNVRAMTDIEFQQIIAQTHAEVAELLGDISKFPIIQSASDQDIDAFTVQIGCLPGIAAWQYAYNNNDSQKWLYGFAEFTEQKISVPREVSISVIEDVRRKGDFAKTVASVATPGGVTAGMLEAMKGGEFSYAKLHEAGMNRIHQIARQL